MTKELQNNKTRIRLVATDLDGTLLDSSMGLPAENKAALERCAQDGITIVVATGRSLMTVPEAVRNIRGLKWLVCSNGAKIYDNVTGEQLYARFLSAEAVAHVSELIRDASIMKEVFWQGVAYTDKVSYEHSDSFGVPARSQDYIKRTRRPVDSIADFAFDHIHEIENINFIYGDTIQRLKILNALSSSDLYTLTSSFSFNFEIGGIGVSKAVALEEICAQLGVDASEVLAIGDNSNDLSMIEFAGIGVAMQDATHDVRQAADTVTLANDDLGVAFAINTLCFS
ncbi:MAG: Cof-type HAD-IIB family hydrolase [Clostridiales Family XIII bacterium]|jgi:Cof subfamily protein (haloacid dehalogenase superfamily)|nr:Cof-type HAD-IIB family hydrolase [Clostridiales Family XIII bacterium]